MLFASSRRVVAASSSSKPLQGILSRRGGLVSFRSGQAAGRRGFASAATPRPLTPLHAAARRHFSSEAAGAAAAATTTKPAPVRDFFLDNLGKIFLGIIAAIILSLVRSSYGTSNMKAQIAELEEASALDPLEIDELRQANTELTPNMFRIIMKELSTRPSALTYEEFVTQVRSILKREKGDHCTIGLGYLLDRVVIAALRNGRLKKKQENGQGASAPFGEDTAAAVATTGPDDDLTMPLTFWLTVLSLALNGPVPDRIRVLYELMEQECAKNNNNALEVVDSNNKKVTLGDVVTMVGYLQETCQLVPDKQVIPTETKYPTQQYRRGEPEELVIWGEAAAAAAAAGANQEEVLDVDAFADILRSKSVCAWGECYFKKKFVP